MSPGREREKRRSTFFGNSSPSPPTPPIACVSSSSSPRQQQPSDDRLLVAVFTPSAKPDLQIEQQKSGPGAAHHRREPSSNRTKPDLQTWRRRKTMMSPGTQLHHRHFPLCSANVRRPFLSRRHRILLAVNSDNPSPASPEKEGSMTSRVKPATIAAAVFDGSIGARLHNRSHHRRCLPSPSSRVRKGDDSVAAAHPIKTTTIVNAVAGKRRTQSWCAAIEGEPQYKKIGRLRAWQLFKERLFGLVITTESKELSARYSTNRAIQSDAP
nr:hypothetical protein Iba_chr01bCG6150 [Ipomoea batatas]